MFDKKWLNVCTPRENKTTKGKQDEGKGSKTVIHALYAIGPRDKKVQKT